MPGSKEPLLGAKIFQEIFTYIPEKKFIYIYNLGRIESYDSGEYLFKEGGQDQTVFLILEGEFSLTKRVQDQELILSSLKAGEWIGEVAFLENQPRVASAEAVRDASVLALDKEIFETLDSSSQLALMKRFNALAAQRYEQLALRQKELMEQQKQLTSSITSTLNTERYIYSESELIQTFLQGIPRLPVYAVNLITRLSSQEVTMEEIARVVKQDPTLAAQVLRVANSAYYGFQQQIRDLQHAITLLGLNQIHLLVTFYAVRSTMPRTKEFNQLQIRSVVMSYVATQLAGSMNQEKAAVIGTLGLLHDIGRSIILLFKQLHPDTSLLYETMDPNLLGSLLLKSWQLPEEIYESIRFLSYFPYAKPQDIPEVCRENVTMLSLAHMVMKQFGGNAKRSIPSPFIQEYKEMANLGGYSIEEIAELKVLEPLRKKWKTLPSIVRNYLSKAKTG